MALRFFDGINWCSFAGSVYKYTFAAGFQGTGTQTLTGSIDAGPFAGTKGIRYAVANCSVANFFGNKGWELDANLGAGAASWIVSVWVKPQGITSRQTFYALRDQEVPNYNAKMALHINAANKLEIDFQQAPLRMNTLFGTQHLTSAYTFPDNAWTHICIAVNFLGGSSGNVTLWINGGMDSFLGGLNLLTSAQVQTVTLCWQNAGSAQITMSTPIVFDTSGAVNNSRISPNARVTTIFPASDVSNGLWMPSGAGGNFAQVNNPAFNAPASYVTIATLAGDTDEQFGISPLGTTDSNLGLALNTLLIGAGTQTVQGLMKQGATKYLLGSPITAPVAAGSYQSIADVNPATGAAWKDSDISADAWGFRALTGTGENVYQFYLEKLWQTTLGSYSY